MNIEQIRDRLDDFGDRLPVVVILPSGEHVRVAGIVPATTDNGEGGYEAAAGIEVE